MYVFVFSHIELTLNVIWLFLQSLATLVKDHLAANVACTSQLPLRCQMCTNPVCGKTKGWFAGHQSVLDHSFQTKISAAGAE